MRDEFTNKLKETLARRVNMHCSNIDCQKHTSGPNTSDLRATNIGVAAHITAASCDGPRYNPSLSVEERRSIQNAIWLCQNCAKLVDSDPEKYSKEMLVAWKTVSEQIAQKELEGAPTATFRPNLILQPRDLFLIGCTVGQRFALLPEEDTAALDEFLEAIERIGFRNNECIISLENLRKKASTDGYPVETLGNFIKCFYDFAPVLRNNLSPQDFRWVNLGLLIFETATLGAIDFSSEDKSQHIEFLKNITELIDLPPEIKNRLRNYCSSALTNDPVNTIGEAQKIALLLHNLL